MNSQAVGIVASVLTIIPGIVTADTSDTRGESVLVVRTYSNHTVSAQDLRTARTYTDAIFADAGIDVSWIDCGAKNQEQVETTPTCNQPLAPNEVILRIQTIGPVEARYSSMGMSLVSGQPGGAPALFSTVFADRVASIARIAGVDARRVLGYAFAHELGHLLLNNPRHPGAGLMRAIWSGAELRRNRVEDWIFGREQAQTMRGSIAARIGRSQP